MAEVVISINHLEDLDEVMEVANTVFLPNEAEKSKYHRKEDWILKINNGAMFSARLEGKVVGFAICYKKDKIFHIWNVGVLPENRKNGIWQKIFESIVIYAKENKFDSISLNTYKEKFPGMYNFCQTQGFTEYNTEIDQLSGSVKSMFSKKL